MGGSIRGRKRVVQTGVRSIIHNGQCATCRPDGCKPKRKEMFLVDVKGLYRRNPWLVKRKDSRANLFFVLAYVPTSEPNQFFVMAQAQADKFIDDELRRFEATRQLSSNRD